MQKYRSREREKEKKMAKFASFVRKQKRREKKVNEDNNKKTIFFT